VSRAAFDELATLVALKPVKLILDIRLAPLSFRRYLAQRREALPSLLRTCPRSAHGNSVGIALHEPTVPQFEYWPSANMNVESCEPEPAGAELLRKAH
jgi:hypothetical protein